MKKHKPIEEYQMEKSFPDCTICETVRQIYKLTDDMKIRLLCRLAVAMGKAMDAKLRSYKEDWGKEFWDKTSDQGG